MRACCRGRLKTGLGASDEVLTAVKGDDDLGCVSGGAVPVARGPLHRERREGGVAGRVVHGLEAEHGDDAAGYDSSIRPPKLSTFWR